MTKTSYIWVAAMTLIISCGNKAQPPAAADSTATEEVRTPVTVANPGFGDLTDSIELNATSTFLLSSYLKSTATGYVRQVNARPGEFVPKGTSLFTIETKESMIIGNSISKLDSSFKFSGVSAIRSATSGYVTQLNHQAGDYVQDGEQLAVISDAGSFAFLLNLPYELRPFVLNKKNVDLVLPDGVHLSGRISAVMPVVDSLSQTQPVIIKVSSNIPIPQNLIAKVRIVKSIRYNAQTLPKSAILSDEAQTSFWVMKMIDTVTAVRTPIRKGIELNDKVEILDPKFSRDDRIIVVGNYGLSDTAKVTIEKQ